MGHDEITITEKQFESQVKHLAKLYHWLYYHTWRSVHSPTGFPDCVMVRDGTVVFAELKSDKGKLSEHQEEWIAALNKVSSVSLGVQVYVWRPSDWDKIMEVLK